MTQHDWALKQL